jgi:hypothetical protein
MTRTTKYVALDVHQATTVASVRTETGQVIARTILPTESPPLVEFFRGTRGTVHVAFEEGTQAQWLHDVKFRPNGASCFRGIGGHFHRVHCLPQVDVSGDTIG